MRDHKLIAGCLHIFCVNGNHLLIRFHRRIKYQPSSSNTASTVDTSTGGRERERGNDDDKVNDMMMIPKEPDQKRPA